MRQTVEESTFYQEVVPSRGGPAHQFDQSADDDPFGDEVGDERQRDDEGDLHRRREDRGTLGPETLLDKKVPDRV